MTSDHHQSGVTPNRAALAVVGVGIQCGGQTTLEARTAIERADVVLFGVADANAVQWLRSLNANISSFEYPRDGRSRSEIYRAMAQRALSYLDAGQRVCAVFYGSPSTLTDPARAAVQLAREAGYAACLLPGVSFLECLFVDLEIDPGSGCQIYEANAWLQTKHSVDVYSHLILCQPAVVGAQGKPSGAVSRAAALGLLQQRLLEAYPRTHRVAVYEAASSPTQLFRCDWLPLSQLSQANVSERSTLYFPPVGPRVVDEPWQLQVAQLANE